MKLWCPEFAKNLPDEPALAIRAVLEQLMTLYLPADIPVARKARQLREVFENEMDQMVNALLPTVRAQWGEKLQRVPAIVVHAMTFPPSRHLQPQVSPIWKLLGRAAIRDRVRGLHERLHDYFVSGGGFRNSFEDGREAETLLGAGELFANLPRFQPEFLSRRTAHDLIHGICSCSQFVAEEYRQGKAKRCARDHSFNGSKPAEIWKTIDKAVLGFSHEDFNKESASKPSATFMNGAVSKSMAGHQLRDVIQTGTLMRPFCSACGCEAKGNCLVEDCPLQTADAKALFVKKRSWLFPKPYMKSASCGHVVLGVEAPSNCPECHKEDVHWERSQEFFETLQFYRCQFCTGQTTQAEFEYSRMPGPGRNIPGYLAKEIKVWERFAGRLGNKNDKLVAMLRRRIPEEVLADFDVLHDLEDVNRKVTAINRVKETPELRHKRSVGDRSTAPW